jgi:hypothetical protein
MLALRGFPPGGFMKVFLSWSGEKSRLVAAALRDWLPDLLQSVAPWMSQRDIDAGGRWSPEIQAQLEQSSFGVICVTDGNQAEPWLLFETGALAKTLSDTYVCPYLIDMDIAALRPGPLTQFQAKRANKQETRDLVTTMNKALGDLALERDQLERAFDKWWPDLEAALTKLPADAAPMKPRSTQDLLDEILVVVRGLGRDLSQVRQESLLALLAIVGGGPTDSGTPEQTQAARILRAALAPYADWDSLIHVYRRGSSRPPTPAGDSPSAPPGPSEPPKGSRDSA